MNKVFVNLVKVQFKEFFRQPSVLFWGFLFPIAIAAVLGLAFLRKTDQTPIVGLVGAEIPQVNQVLAQQDKQKFNFVSLNEKEALQQLSRAEIGLYLEYLADEKKMIFHYDPTNSEARLVHLQLENALLKSAEQLQFRVAHVTAKGSRYIDFLIPGLLAMGIMNSCLWGIGWNLIDFRIKKLLRRMIATPMKKSTFLLAQIVSRGILVFIEAIMILLFSVLVFHVQLKGTWMAFMAIFLTGVIAFSGIGVLISSRARHSQVGNGLINAVTLPLIILSGIFFSYQNFPDWAVNIIQYLPLTLLADGLRQVFNQGANLLDVFPKMIGLTAIGLLFFGIGLKIYKWY
ncbi:MAG: ABC transporter permease [Candidatus Cyclobacteriaceae bacterium M3_2C_046]